VLSIKRIKKQMERPVNKQAAKYRLIIERINFLHKILLVYRLVHHSDDLMTNELPLNIFGRPLELCGPSIQLYHTLNNKAEDDPDKHKIRNKVMGALGHFLRKKGELDKKTIEGVLHKILDDIINEMDADNERIRHYTSREERTDLQGNEQTYHIITYEEICNRFMEEVEGESISKRTFECADFGKVTHDHLISRCRDVFGGTPENIGRE
jgi:hypothetical protein